eukprot:SAG31_NODE_4957_length_2836_cov_2.451023_5_plen_63_part_00
MQVFKKPKDKATFFFSASFSTKAANIFGRSVASTALYAECDPSSDSISGPHTLSTVISLSLL